MDLVKNTLDEDKIKRIDRTVCIVYADAKFFVPPSYIQGIVFSIEISAKNMLAFATFIKKSLRTNQRVSLGLDQNQVAFESSRVRVTDQILSFSLGNVSINNLTGESGNPLYPFMFEFERNASVGLRYGERGSSFDFLYCASIFAPPKK